MSKLHIRSGFSVYTRPSERCGTPASTPCSGGRQPRPRGPSLTFLSPSSRPPLILIQPGMPFALYGLLACSTATAPSMPPRHWNTVSPHKNHISSLCSGRQLHQIEHVSPVGGGERFLALSAARPGSSEAHCYSLCYYYPKENRSCLWGGSEAKFQSKLTVHNTHYMPWKSHTRTTQNIFQRSRWQLILLCPDTADFLFKKQREWDKKEEKILVFSACISISAVVIVFHWNMVRCGFK